MEEKVIGKFLITLKFNLFVTGLFVGACVSLSHLFREEIYGWEVLYITAMLLFSALRAIRNQ